MPVSDLVISVLTIPRHVGGLETQGVAAVAGAAYFHDFHRAVTSQATGARIMEIRHPHGKVHMIISLRHACPQVGIDAGRWPHSSQGLQCMHRQGVKDRITFFSIFGAFAIHSTDRTK